MINVERLAREVMDGKIVTREEALEIYDAPLEELSKWANVLREHFCGNAFDICTIVNGKCGRCSENCKFCAQSMYNHTGVNDYPLLSTDELLEDAKANDDAGVLRYSIVTSGRRLSNREVDKMCEAVKTIRANTGIKVCASFGLLDEEQFRKLKEAGVSRIHNNLETSRRNFKNVCTTHTFDDKIKAIKAAQRAGLNVCSGGIVGLGETKEDRVDVALELRELGIKSVPVNMLNPIKGTPMENNKRLTSEDMCRVVAMLRFVLPHAMIRLAGGRGLLEDKGRSIFLSGANAAISGDMLTTAGITVATDMKMLKELGYEVRIIEE